MSVLKQKNKRYFISHLFRTGLDSTLRVKLWGQIEMKEKCSAEAISNVIHEWFG